MKYRHAHVFFVAAAVLALVSCPVLASNKGVDAVMLNRPDISLFREAMIKTGVNDELKDDQKYTVFAPSNEAFSQIMPNPNACYVAPACKSQLAAVVRDHIVPDRAYIDALYQAGPAVPSIGNDLVHIERIDFRQGIYRVEGHTVLRIHDNDVGLAYTIDGVLVDDAQIAALQNALSATVNTSEMPNKTQAPAVTPAPATSAQ